MIAKRHHMAFSNQVPEEWPYFIEWARRFEDNVPEHRYGILIMGTDPKEENMIYAPDVMELRLKHIDYLLDHSELLRQTISGFVNFLNWLEGMEGKKVNAPKSADIAEEIRRRSL